MARKTITHKPLSNQEYTKVKGKDPLVDLFIYTGVRIAEMKRLIDGFYEKGISNGYVDITTKYSGTKTNRIFLTIEAIKCLKKLKYYHGKAVRTLSQHIRNTSDKLGIYFSSHNLRATTATRLLDLGVDIVTVASILNHSDISMTAQYIHFSEDKKIAALGMLENYVTLKGMTIYELSEELVRKEQRILRLENQIKLLKGEI